MGDPDETTDVAAAHPDVVKHLLAEAEKARQYIGDHDRVGDNMRFFDPMNERPKTPPDQNGVLSSDRANFSRISAVVHWLQMGKRTFR